MYSLNTQLNSGKEDQTLLVEPYQGKERRGYIGGCFKPFHKGHWLLVQAASRENDQVKLFVSLKDREGIGEIMREVWINHLIPILPNNVACVFSEQSPVKDIYVSLAFEDRSGLSDNHAIYSDPEDSKRYTDKKLSFFCPRLVQEQLVYVVAMSRELTNNISGTQMRKYLIEGNREAFEDNLPLPLSNTAKENIFHLLNKKFARAILCQYGRQ